MQSLFTSCPGPVRSASLARSPRPRLSSPRPPSSPPRRPRLYSHFTARNHEHNCGERASERACEWVSVSGRDKDVTRRGDRERKKTPPPPPRHLQTRDERRLLVCLIPASWPPICLQRARSRNLHSVFSIMSVVLNYLFLPVARARPSTHCELTPRCGLWGVRPPK